MSVRKYPKINALYKRYGPKNLLNYGDWAQPEFEVLKDAPWTASEKIDGTNLRVDLAPWTGTHVNVYGRTNATELHPDLVKGVRLQFAATAYRPETECILFGEGLGPKVQGGTYGVPYQFVLFDVFSGEIWWSPEAVKGLADSMGLPCARQYGATTILDAERFVAEGFPSAIRPDLRAEGLVLHAPYGMLNRFGSRISTKIKHKDYAHIILP